MKEYSFLDDVLPLKNKLYRLALRILIDTADAEDTVQDTLIQVWNHRDEFPKIESIEAYSLTVCRNLALNKMAKKDYQHQSLDDTAGDLPGDEDKSPYEKLSHNERMATVQRLFNKLPEKARSVMQLRDIEGKSYKEIATIMGITEEQVKVTLFRARQRIRIQYEKIERYGL